MEHELQRIGDHAYKNTDVIKYNSSRIYAQQKVLAITDMEAAEMKIKMFGLGDKFEKLTDRTAQRLTSLFGHSKPKNQGKNC